MGMEKAAIETRRNGRVAMIVIDRPKALNALNGSVIREITDQVEALSANDGVGAIVITGAGDKAFVAGADINQFATATPAAAEQLALLTKRMHDALRDCTKPVLAAVNGFCLGAGFELALACDIRIASSTAKFGLPEIKLGILPGGGGTVRLSRLVGASVASALAFTGETMTAERAFNLGILHSVHEPEALLEASASIAEKLASYSPYALGQLKAALNAAANADAESAFMTEIKCFASCFSTEDQKEGAAAFLEKRLPRYTGR